MSDNTNLLDKLEEEFPTSVQLAEGDAIEGIFEKVDQGYTREYGQKYLIIFDGIQGTYHDVKTKKQKKFVKGEKYTLWLFHDALLSQAKRERPKTGEHFAAKNLGKRTPESGGNAYVNYRFIVDREKQETTWDAIDNTNTVDNESEHSS